MGIIGKNTQVLSNTRNNMSFNRLVAVDVIFLVAELLLITGLIQVIAWGTEGALFGVWIFPLLVFAALGLGLIWAIAHYSARDGHQILTTSEENRNTQRCYL